MTDNLVIGSEAGVVTITIDRAPVNALSNELRRNFLRVIKDVSNDSGTNVILVKGAGRGFCAGSDIREFPAEMQQGSGRARAEMEFEFFDGILRVKQPTIAAVHGFALGGGLELALTMDVCIAADSARLGFPEVNLGGFSPVGFVMSHFLVSGALSRKWFLSGEQLSGAQAASAGLIAESVPDGQLEDRAAAFARELAQRPQSSAFTIKEMSNIPRRQFLHSHWHVLALYFDGLWKSQEGLRRAGDFLRAKA